MSNRKGDSIGKRPIGKLQRMLIDLSRLSPHQAYLMLVAYKTGTLSHRQIRTSGVPSHRVVRVGLPAQAVVLGSLGPLSLRAVAAG